MRTFLVYSAAALIVLTGCDTTDTVDKAPTKGNVNGLVVVPVTADDNGTLPAGCSTLPIPGGYLPLADANVTYIDTNGTAVLSQMTDDCGRFYGNIDTAGLTTVHVGKEGYHTMVSDMTSFDNGGIGWGIVSTADVNNSFAVRINTEGQSMSYVPKNGTFKYSVVDTKTGRAVLGIPESQVSLYKNKDEVEITDYLFNDLDADIVLTLDASGSMTADLTDANGTAIGTGFDVTYAASKAFIDELSGNAQLGINIFDQQITFINNAFIGDLKLSGSFKYAADGFERDKKSSKFVIDIYHPNSHVYEANSTLVPEYPYTTSEPYTWGGATAYIDAASTAVEKLSNRAAEQKIAVLMTDGGDNSSVKTITDVIEEARKADVTFYTISMGSFTDQNLESLAAATGGVYIKADGSDISDKFADVLSEIQYFYEVGTVIEANTTAYYRVDVVLDGETVSGIIDYNSTIPPQPQPPVDDSEGAQLYAKCMPCHGAYGEQSAYGVTAAINTMDSATLKSLLSEYKAGTRDMYGYGDMMHMQVDTYSEDQIDTLSQYIPTLLTQYVESIADSEVSTTELDGETLYSKCSACHGVNGEKAALGISAVIGGAEAGIIAADLFEYRDSDLNKYGMGALMKGQVATYTDEQIESVAEYISTLSGE